MRGCHAWWIVCALALAGGAPAAPEDAALAPWRAADAPTRAFVLSLARRAFDTFSRERRVIEPPARIPAALRGRVGVFVSTMRGGAPRCCMGSLYPMEPDAAREIIASAAAAAGRDRRFPPIQPRELKGLTLMVSLVGTPRPITAAAAAALDPTRDGLVARRAGRCGVVLSGETPHVERMLRWARIRAGAREGEPVEYFRLEVVRFVEGR